MKCTWQRKKYQRWYKKSAKREKYNSWKCLWKNQRRSDSVLKVVATHSNLKTAERKKTVLLLSCFEMEDAWSTYTHLVPILDSSSFLLFTKKTSYRSWWLYWNILFSAMEQSFVFHGSISAELAVYLIWFVSQPRKLQMLYLRLLGTYTHVTTYLLTW